MTDNDKFNRYLGDACAVALGLVVPAMVSGRAVLQGLAGAALIGALILCGRDQALRTRWSAAVGTHLSIAVLVAFAGMAVCIPGSLDPQRSFEAWARSLGYIGACTLFWAYLAGDHHARRLCQRTFVAVSLFGLSVVILAQLGWELPYRIVRNDFYPTNSHWPFHSAKAYAAAAACCLPVCLWIARHESGGWRMTAGFAALGQIVLMVTTANKAALAGLLALVLITSLAIALRAGRRFLAAWTVGAIGATAVMLLLVYELPDEPAARPVWDWLPAQLVDTHRQQIWHFTAGKIAENPWTGYGINVIDRVAGARDTLPGYTVEAIPSHPHNWMLEILAETGVVGFLPLLVAIGWLVVRSFRRFVRSADESALAQLGVTAVFWGSSLFNFSIWSSWWLISYFMLIAITAAGTPSKTRPSPET